MAGQLLPEASFTPEPRIVYIWGLNEPHRLPNTSKMEEGETLPLLGRVWRPIGPAKTPNINDFRIRPKPWLQMARTLVSVAVVAAQPGGLVGMSRRWSPRAHSSTHLAGPVAWPTDGLASSGGLA